ncbi:MAG TPA: adenylate/guanylate cyclase domain-containing protein, partial [Rhodobacteraceae bacterium]|nr:adenylate/guanylate cyclase domain-containing protein [Paracoccaceae bacterium]
MPRRVITAIERQDNSAEVLVRIIQLSIGIVLGTLYLAAPKTDLGTAFSPVPYALAVYLTLTFIGLVWSTTRSLPSWAIYLSILFDMTLLMGLIW